MITRARTAISGVARKAASIRTRNDEKPLSANTTLNDGGSLRERYDVPAELPPKLLTLVKKLDAIEGNHLLRNSEITPDHAPTSKKAFDDLSLCT